MKLTLTCLVVALAAAGCASQPKQPLSGSSWAVSAVDDEGNDWQGSTLFLQTDQANAQGERQLSGHFCWTTAVAKGKEIVQGTLAADGRLKLVGKALPAPSQNLVLGHYLARLSPDAQALTAGHWLSPDDPNLVPSTWAAQRSAKTFSRCAWE